MKPKKPKRIESISGTMIENENDKTNDSKKNEDSDGDESEIIENFSKMLLGNSKEEEFQDKSKKKEEIEEKPKRKETEERKKQKEEPEEKNDNKMRISDELKPESIDLKPSVNFNSQIPIIEKPISKKNTIDKISEKRQTFKKDKNIAQNSPRKTILDPRAILKNNFNNFASNNKILKRFLGKLMKNETVLQAVEPEKNDVMKKIIDDSDFDYLNFYENEIPNFGGNMYTFNNNF